MLDSKSVLPDVMWVFAGSVFGYGLAVNSMHYITMSLTSFAVSTVYCLNPDMKQWVDAKQKDGEK